MRPKGSADLLSDRRRRALKLLDEEFSLNEVARRLHCAASSVSSLWRDFLSNPSPKYLPLLVSAPTLVRQVFF